MLIDEYDLELNQLRVRDRPLLDLVNELAYASLVIFAITGVDIDSGTAEDIAANASEVAARLLGDQPTGNAHPDDSFENSLEQIARIILSADRGALRFPGRSPWPQFLTDDQW